MLHLTELEKEVIKVLREPNGNGTEIDTYTEDYISLFDFGIDGKILRGVLASLVKKNIIILNEEKCDWGIETTVKFTESGYTLEI